MSFKLIGSRTQFELRVGDHHSVDVVLHARRQDVDATRQRWDEILLLLQTSILPRMFHNEIEVSRAKILRKTVPPELGPGGIPIEAGEKDRQQSRRARKTAKSSTARARATQQERCSADSSKREKEVYYAVGKKVKLAYRLQEPKGGPSATFLVDDDKTYKLLTKLSKTICVWSYPCDPGAGSNDANDDGLAACGDEPLLTAGRPEKIPLSSLFRQYAEAGKK